MAGIEKGIKKAAKQAAGGKGSKGKGRKTSGGSPEKKVANAAKRALK